MNQSPWRPFILMMLLVMLFNIGYSYLQRDAGQIAEISYSRFRRELVANNLKMVRFKEPAASGEFLKKIKLTETVQGKEVKREVGAFTIIMPAVADPALLAELTDHKVTIIPHGMALGLTQQLPEDDHYHYPRSYLENRICVALGGRAAERLFFGEVSTRAQSDLKTVTDLAEKWSASGG